MDDAYGFRHCDPVTQDDLAARRAGSIGQALELQAGEDIRQASITILRDAAGIEQVVTCGQDDLANIDFAGSSSCWLKSIAPVGQNFSQALQVPFWKYVQFS